MSRAGPVSRPGWCQFAGISARLLNATKINSEEGGQTSRDNFLPISTKLMADHEILLKARVVAIIFGFPSFVFNE